MSHINEGASVMNQLSTIFYSYTQYCVVSWHPANKCYNNKCGWWVVIFAFLSQLLTYARHKDIHTSFVSSSNVCTLT